MQYACAIKTLRSRLGEITMQHAFLTRLGSLLGLSEEDQSWIEAFCRTPRPVRAGTDLASEGRTSSTVQMLLDGFAVRYKLSPRGDQQILAYVIPGDFCDLHVAILDRMDHSIRTQTACKVVDIPCSAILEASRTRPNLVKVFWWCSLLNEGILREWIFNLGHKPADQRVAHLFCEMHARLHSIGLTDLDGSYTFPVSQAELGNTVGTSVVHINRTLKVLREAGLAHLQRSRVTIMNLPALRAYAAFDPGYLHLQPRVQ